MCTPDLLARRYAIHIRLRVSAALRGRGDERSGESAALDLRDAGGRGDAVLARRGTAEELLVGGEWKSPLVAYE